MSGEFFLIAALIAVLSVVQSVFGIGILVFGTPVLLLLGYEFATTLSYLLPASLAVSALQVFRFQGRKPPISGYLYALCLPGIALGLWFSVAALDTSIFHYLIGGILLASALVRFNHRLQHQLSETIKTHEGIYHLAMGVIHGLTNLGGGLLTIFASSTCFEKQSVRYTIAFYYLFFSLSQLLVLAFIVKFPGTFSTNILTALVSSAVYLVVGDRIFARANEDVFQIALSGFIAACGIAILLKA